MLEKFTFESQEIRLVTFGDEIWFVGKDVALVLGYTDVTHSIRDHCDSEDTLSDIELRKKLKEFSQGHFDLVTRAIYINESGVYSLIFGSTKPQAKLFKRWVTREVLPSIRKTGKYELPNNNQSEILDLKIQLKSQEIRIATLELEILKNQKKLEENPYLAKILKLLEVKGEITAGEAYLNNKSIWKKLNMKTNDVGELLLQLVDMGKAIKVPTKKGIRIKAKKQ